MAELLSPLAPFPVRAELIKFIKFINNVRTSENRNFIFECEKIYQLALSLEYNSKIAVGEFIFHYTINYSANLKQIFTQIW